MSAREKPHLLVLTSTFPSERGDATPGFVADLAEHLADRFNITVLAPAIAGAAPDEEWDGVRIRRFRYCWPANTQRLADGAILPNLRRSPILVAQIPLFVVAQLIAAWRLARSERYDLVHAHWVLPQGFVAALLRWRFRTPVLVTSHGADLYALRWRPLEYLKRFVLRRVDALTAVSTSICNEMLRLGVPPERVSVIPMGVDTTHFHPEAWSPSLRAELNPDGPLLLFVGRLAEKKGVRYAIEAMPAVLNEFPTARLVIAGDGPDRNELEQLASDLQLGEHVRFVGAVPNREVPAYCASADIFIGPSVQAGNGDAEALGLVFAEALASGTPVIATDTGGVADVVQNGVNGLLVPQRSSDAIANAIVQMLADPSFIAQLRSAARESARPFDVSSVAQRYGDALEEVVR